MSAHQTRTPFHPRITLDHLRDLAMSLRLKRTATDSERALLRSLTKMAALSRELDCGIQLYGRIKSVVSTSEKMLRNGLDVHEILDAIGIRAVTEHSRDCYRLIRRIHSGFPVLERAYDDYIAAPKSNGYRSLHTTVFSPCGLPIEIQVRTSAMHAHAERGPASHADYKKLRASEDGDGWGARSS